MDHDAAREQLELAAVEPGGLERLMAGDTAEAQAVAAHLAGCPACADELARLELTASIVRSTLREQPAPDLKARTLAAIRAEGVARPLAKSEIVVPAGERPRRLTPMVGTLLTIAAAVVLSVVATSLVVGTRVDEQLAAQARTIAALERVTTAGIAVAAEPDAAHVALVGVSDPALAGQLTYSPSTSELVIVASGLAAPGEGQEYRCWIEFDGARQAVGKMYFSDDVSFWAGEAEALAGAPEGATFGVSLVGSSGSPLDVQPVLVGGL